MRLPYARVLVVVSAMLGGCGGGTPTPKDETDAVEHGSSKSDRENKEATDSPTAAATPAPASDPTSAPPTTKASSGDLVVPPSDDPWMAAHQMPAGDVLRTMRAATGKVNACWHAAKKRGSSVAGEVKIKFVISHEGSVRVWRNEDSTLSDEDAIKCVGEVVKSLKFPTQKSPGDAWGIFAINFGG